LSRPQPTRVAAPIEEEEEEVFLIYEINKNNYIMIAWKY